MGERAKKKRAEESRARKSKKATEQASQLEEPASRSNAGSSKKTQMAPAPRVPSSSAATRHSTRLLSSSSKPGSSGKRTSVEEGSVDESIATRPQRSVTAAANALLQQLQIGDAGSGDSEEDADGSKSNDVIDMIEMFKL